MSVKYIYSKNKLKGEVTVPGDKSISHRSVMFGAIASGMTEITNFLQGADCLSTIQCFQRMGIEIEWKRDFVLVYGKGLRGIGGRQQRDNYEAYGWDFGRSGFWLCSVWRCIFEYASYGTDYGALK